MDDATADFARQLRALGYEPVELAPNRLAWGYTIEVGRLTDTAIKIGIEVPPDFDRTPPSGPHISPRILPINATATEHPHKVVDSPFGGDWEYWSRPYSNWGKDGRTVNAYYAFLRRLFSTL